VCVDLDALLEARGRIRVRNCVDKLKIHLPVVRVPARILARQTDAVG
jgi:hypothetical protein